MDNSSLSFFQTLMSQQARYLFILTARPGFPINDQITEHQSTTKVMALSQVLNFPSDYYSPVVWWVLGGDNFGCCQSQDFRQSEENHPKERFRISLSYWLASGNPFFAESLTLSLVEAKHLQLEGETYDLMEQYWLKGLDTNAMGAVDELPRYCDFDFRVHCAAP